MLLRATATRTRLAQYRVASSALLVALGFVPCWRSCQSCRRCRGGVVATRTRLAPYLSAFPAALGFALLSASSLASLLAPLSESSSRGGNDIILDIIHCRCKRRLVNSRASSRLRHARRLPPCALMGVVVGFVVAGKRRNPPRRRCRCNRCRFFVARASGGGAHQSPCRHEVLARADAVSALWALSATLSRPGGPNNAAKLNGPSRWALLDVREAGKKSAALTPCPGFP